MANGYSIDRDTEFSLLVSQEMTEGRAIMYKALLGNSYSSTPRLSIQVNMASVNGKTRVMAYSSIRMANAFGREDSQDMTQQSGVRLMEYLSQAKSQMERK
jgi:hypothetical protein